MDDKTCDILFEYLRSILYDTTVKAPDISTLEPSARKLGMGLLYLQKAVEEMQAYTADLSRGNLSGEFPSKENFLCVNLKNLHANLNHLTWQAQQVAAGDYSQQVSYLGDFSKAFNEMTAQLKEREKQLTRKAETLLSYNELFYELTRSRKEWILVVDSRTSNILYCNKVNHPPASLDLNPHNFCEGCTHTLPIKCDLLNWTEERPSVWEQEDASGAVYQITTYSLEWMETNVFVHIVTDITENRMEEKALADKAYRDAGTGVYNRHFFDEYMNSMLREKRDITLCYMDLDGLKYTNDAFGHTEGDQYIHDYVAAIQKNIRTTDIFARLGGDEFCIIFPGCCKMAASAKIDAVLSEFIKENSCKPYPVSFSYGILDVHGQENTYNPEQLIKIVDREMYRCKQINKQKYHTHPATPASQQPPQS